MTAFKFVGKSVGLKFEILAGGKLIGGAILGGRP
jgi:hypothetical protein